MPVRRVEIGPVGEIVRTNIRSTRLILGMTQTELAAKANLPAQAITEIENGARRVNVDDLVNISGALGVSPQNMLVPGVPA